MSLSADATIVIDVGDGRADRSDVIAELDALLGARDGDSSSMPMRPISRAARRVLKHPERLVGFGILGSFESQTRRRDRRFASASPTTRLALAQELFESLGKGVVLVEDVPGLFLGRIVGSIVNEAIIAVHEDVAVARRHRHGDAPGQPTIRSGRSRGAARSAARA